MAQQGPWSNVPNVLQDILAEKRAEQHQKLVDTLNLLETQSQMENQRQQVEALAEERKASAAESRQKKEALERYTTAGQKYIQGLPVSLSPEERGLREFAASDPDLMRAFINQTVGTQGTQPATVAEYEYAKKQGYPGSFIQYQTDDANLKRVQPPRDTGTYIGPAKDKSGAVIFGKHVIMQNGAMRVVDTPDIGIAPKPIADRRTGVLPVGLGIRMAAAKGKVAGSKGWWNPKGTKAARGEYDVLAQQAVSYAKSPKVREIARMVLTDPTSESENTPIADIVSRAARRLSEEELIELRDILSEARGQ